MGQRSANWDGQPGPGAVSEEQSCREGRLFAAAFMRRIWRRRARLSVPVPCVPCRPLRLIGRVLIVSSMLFH